MTAFGTFLSIASNQIWPQVLSVGHLKPDRVLLLHSEDTSESKGPAQRLKRFFDDPSRVPKGGAQLELIPQRLADLESSAHWSESALYHAIANHDEIHERRRRVREVIVAAKRELPWDGRLPATPPQSKAPSSLRFAGALQKLRRTLPDSSVRFTIGNRHSAIANLKNVLIRVHPRHPWSKPSCPMNPSPDITWKIAADPATLSGDEFWARYSHLNMPEKFEVIEGKLFWNDEQRLHVLAMLLEAVGLRRALALCPPDAIRATLAEQPR
jgi:hypothetical protein